MYVQDEGPSLSDDEEEETRYEQKMQASLEDTFLEGIKTDVELNQANKANKAIDNKAVVPVHTPAGAKNDVGSSLQVQWKPTNAEPQVGAAAPAKSALKHTET